MKWKLHFTMERHCWRKNCGINLRRSCRRSISKFLFEELAIGCVENFDANFAEGILDLVADHSSFNHSGQKQFCIKLNNNNFCHWLIDQQYPIPNKASPSCLFNYFTAIIYLAILKACFKITWNVYWLIKQNWRFRHSENQIRLNKVATIAF